MRLPASPIMAAFDRWQPFSPRSLSAADIEPLSMTELLALADDATRPLWDSLTLGYTAAAGHPAFRDEIACWLELEPEDVLTFAGTQEALFVACSVLLSPGDHVVVPAPAYPPLVDIPGAIGAEVSPLPLDPASGWQLDRADLRAAVRPATRLAVLNVPHNPTGTLPDLPAFTGILRAMEERGITVLSDEVFRGLELDPNDRLPCAAALSSGAVSVGGLSKGFGAAGLRIGWIATRNRSLLRRAGEMRYYLSMGGSAPAEILALIALRTREKLLARSREILAANLAHLERFFGAWEDVFTWVRPRSGAVTYPRLREGRAEAFADALVQRERVALLPGSTFHGADDALRLGFGRRDMPDLLDRVDAFLREAKGGPGSGSGTGLSG